MFKILVYAIIILLIKANLSMNVVKLQSKKFQQHILNELSKQFEYLAKDRLNEYLKEIHLPENINNNYKKALQQAINNDEQLEVKCLYIKQWLDVKQQQQQQQQHQLQQQQQQQQQQQPYHQEKLNEMLYLLRNVQFLSKLKQQLKQLEEESIEELHNLRYYQMCKQFKIKHNERLDYQYYAPTKLQPYPMTLDLQGQKEKFFIDLKKFGEELYEKVKIAGADIIDDYLEVIKHLLIDIIDTSNITEDTSVNITETETETETETHSIALDKILMEINVLLNISDFYEKRQHLYNYLQNNLTLDFELLHRSSHAEQHLLHVYEKFKEKGMDLIVTFLFSNFEFLEELHQQLSMKIPTKPLEMFNEQTRLLRQIELFYDDFKADLENTMAYDDYLQAAKNLYEQTKNNDLDSTHIYELLYSAAQNVGALRINIIADKCKELYEI